ncbi:MAG: riboflavin synthase [Alkalilacustris sp.]
MFTGIITDVGRLLSIETAGDTTLRIATAYDLGGIDLGASIACNGVCLTVVATGTDPVAGGWFSVQASAETLSKTTLGGWIVGVPVNLERALRVGDELGGHIVSGHVDGTAEIVAMRPEGDSLRVRLRAPGALAGFIAPKGSVALDGTSLTVNEVEGAEFGVNLIAHTRKVTNWGTLAEGDVVNIEIDTIARYVARLREWQAA